MVPICLHIDSGKYYGSAGEGCRSKDDQYPHLHWNLRFDEVLSSGGVGLHLGISSE